MAVLRPTQPLHLYRHLLREASYVPPICRPRLVDRIRAAFRGHKDDTDPRPALRRANHELRALRAANAGDLDRMQRLFFHTFGRNGKRRRELLSAFGRPDAPANSAALEQQVRAANELQSPDALRERIRSRSSGKTEDWLDKWDTGKLTKLAKSQRNVQDSFTKRTLPDIPASFTRQNTIPTHNIWGKPLHPKVARTKLKKWWKATLKRLLPPAGRGEWELLGRLATEYGRPEQASDLAEYHVPARRIAAKQTTLSKQGTSVDQMDTRTQDAETLEGSWDWAKYATHAVRHAERQNAKSLQLLAGTNTPENERWGPPMGQHTYKARTWRRLYQHVWGITPVVEKNDKHPDHWSLTWGLKQKRACTASASDAEFFAIAPPSESDSNPQTKAVRANS